MLTHASRAEQARNDTLIHRAQGQALNRLSDFYGLERPAIVKEPYWQDALRQAVYGARGTMGVFNSFLESSLNEFITYATFDIEVVDYRTVRYTGDQAICNLEGRYVNINGRRYFTAHSSGDTLRLSTVNTTYWTAVDLTASIGSTLQMQVLPYVLEEYAGVVKIIIDAGLFTIPPTYLRSNAEARGSEPNGGHIMDLFSTSTSEQYGDQVNGAYPAYLIVEEFFGNFLPVIQKVLAASIQLRIESRVWCVGQPSIYGSLTTYLQTGSVDPDAISATPART